MPFKSRLEFNKALFILLRDMTDAGEDWLIDYVKRSVFEQRWLFEAGKSKCDGEKKVSNHQLGKAVDIYFQEGGEITPPKAGFNVWHARWEELGGQPMLDWDKGHFE